jgi:hypothetical protein
MNTKLLLSGVAIGLLIGISACKKKEAAPAPAPTDTSSAPAPSGSTAPATTPTDNSSTAPASGGSSSSNTHPFGMQSGRVEYAVTGGEQGTEVLTWDNWGNRMSIQTKATVGAATEDKMTIVGTDKVTTVNNIAKTGVSVTNPYKDLIASATSTDDLTAKMMAGRGAAKQGTDTVLGKTCDNYVSPSATACVWQGVVLKTEMKAADGTTTTKVATKIDENATPDATVFDVPAGTTVQDQSATATPDASAAPQSNMAPMTTPAPDASTAPAAPSETMTPATPTPAPSTTPAPTTPPADSSGH